RAGMVGVQQEGGALGAADEVVDIVHPGVVRAQVAPADQDQAVRLPFQRSAQTRDVGDDRFGRQLDGARLRAQYLRDARLQRAEIDPVRVRLEHVEREAVR